MKYESFLETKRIRVDDAGFNVALDDLNEKLFPFQRAIVRWAIRRGRSALFADCGLGKTPMQLEWARLVCEHTDKPVLILAPLAVSYQTAAEGSKFGIDVRVVKSQPEVRDGINVTNYEKLKHFEPDGFSGIVLDESSILKSFDGVTRKELQEFAQDIPFRLCATATPAPNDLTELCNHAEFLSIMQEKEVKALFFTQDGNTVTKWRLKGHATQDFWRWIASWAVACRSPEDLGFDGSSFVLPELKVNQVLVKNSNRSATGMLLDLEAITLQERRASRRSSLNDRVRACAEMVNASNDPWVVWCDLNSESEALTKEIDGAVEVKGSDSNEHKERAVVGFANGTHRVLVTKPSICGWGLNWQHCAHVAFVGLSDSYEQYYQAIRRCWRFGQKHPVECHIITTASDGAVVANIQRKDAQAKEMMESVVLEIAKNLDLKDGAKVEEMPYVEDVAEGNGWKLMLGDSVKRIDEIESDSIGLSVFSPPFPGMYTYTNSPHDIGNTKNIEEMLKHFEFIVEPKKLLRIMMPGRSCCVHLTQATAKKGVDGYIGLKDFRGKTIELMERCGWIYYGKVCIDKDPQVKAIRTKDRGLLFKTLATDSSHMHMALADYLLQFRKPGDNPKPIPSGLSDRYKNTSGWITDEEWIEWAAPVWYRASDHYPGGIRETDVLNVSQARETNDERHLCPLQLGVIERAVKLWSAPGETVFSPFAGIGSEGYVSVQLGRNFIGCELKKSYWQQAVRNLKTAEHKKLSDKNDILSLCK